MSVFGTTYVVNVVGSIAAIGLGAMGFEMVRGANERARIRTISQATAEVAREIGIALSVYNGELDKLVAAQAAIAAINKRT